MRQSIRLTESADGTEIAWAEAGTGPSLVKASNWLTHLEHEPESPVWRHWIRFFADHYRFVRYDERGCGMSDRNVAELSLDRSVDDLDAVVAAAKPREPFILLGISQGGAAAIRFAVANPGKVSHLILYGAYAQGRAMQHDRAVEEAQRARIALTRSGWGRTIPSTDSYSRRDSFPAPRTCRSAGSTSCARSRPRPRWRRGSWSSVSVST